MMRKVVVMFCCFSIMAISLFACPSPGNLRYGPNPPHIGDTLWADWDPNPDVTSAVYGWYQLGGSSNGSKTAFAGGTGRYYFHVQLGASDGKGGVSWGTPADVYLDVNRAIYSFAPAKRYLAKGASTNIDLKLNCPISSYQIYINGTLWKSGKKLAAGTTSFSWNGKINNAFALGDNLIWVSITRNGVIDQASMHCTVFGVTITTATTTTMNISSEPVMPSPTFHADLVPASLSKTGFVFNWYLEMEFKQGNRNDKHRIPIDTNTKIEVKDSGDWAPVFGTLLAGGDVTVSVTVSRGNSGGLNITKSGYKIKGENASGATYRTGASTQESVTMYFESKFCHFSLTDNWPTKSSDGRGWGLMQLTNPVATVAQVWSWIENRTAGCNLLQTKYNEGLAYPAYVRNTLGYTQATDWSTDEQRWTEGFQRYYSGNAYIWVLDVPGKKTGTGHWVIRDSPYPQKPGFKYGVRSWNTTVSVNAGSLPGDWRP